MPPSTARLDWVTAKLMYLQHALKDGPTRFVIQELTQTSESYEEDIKCLKEG